MKAGGGRRKGNAFERKCAAKVRRVFRVPKTECYRTPLSGGHPFGDRGDLCIGPKLLKRFPYLAECKHVRWFTVEILFQPTKRFLDWLVYLQERAYAAGRKPVLFVRGNRTLEFAVIGPLDDLLARTARRRRPVRLTLPGCPGGTWRALLLDDFLALAAQNAQNRGRSRLSH